MTTRKTPMNFVGGIYNAIPPSLTDTEFTALQIDDGGNLKCNIVAGGTGGNDSVSATGDPVPAFATAIGFEDGSGDLQIPSVSNPLPITGSISATNPSVGLTGAAVPTSATFIGVKDGSGNLVGASSANPVRIDPTGTTIQPVSWSSQTVTVTQGTAANLNGTVVFASPQHVIVDSGGGGGTVNQGTAAALTAGWPTLQGQTAQTVNAAWTNATSVNTVLALTVAGYSSVVVTLQQTGNCNIGVVQFEASDTVAGTNWYSIFGSDQQNSFLGQKILGTVTASAAYIFNVAGWIQFRVRLSTAIGSTGQIVFGITAQANVGTLLTSTAITASLPAGANVIGHVITDTGSTTAVTQATAASLNATVVGTGTFAVQATLAAETTKVIGTVNQGTSPWVVSLTSTTITGTVAATQSGNWTSRIVGAAGVTLDAVLGAPKPANLLQVGGNDGTNAYAIPLASGGGKVLVTPDSVALPANQSVNMSQINAHTSLEGGANGSLAVGGTVATNVAITANPLNLGAQAVSSENAAVTTARQVQLVADLVGKLIVLPYANPENFVSGAITSAMTGTTSTSLIAAPASGLRNYITQITVSNSHATVGTNVLIQDGSGGTTIYTIPAAAVYGGAVLSFPTPLKQPSTATAIYAQNETTGASVKVSASGYKGA